MLCDICGQREAVIHIEGEGNFCAECHNERVLRRYGKTNEYQYPKTLTIYDSYGELHTFHFMHLILGQIVSWEAEEVKEEKGYDIRGISYLEDNAKRAYFSFLHKVINAVQTRTLESPSSQISDPIQKPQSYYSLKEKGNIDIDYDENEGTVFRIDGKMFTANQLSEMLSTYEGFQIQFQIRDALSPWLKENEYLVPVEITKESLINRLQDAITAFGGGFVSYKDVSHFEDSFYEIKNLLEVFYASSHQEEAREAASEMLNLMMDLETDDDYFPVPEIEYLEKFLKRP